jgi:hypothetical protein
LVAALVASPTVAARAQTRAATPTLPIGSPLTIVSDETVDPRVRPGSEFRAHLRDAISVGDTLVATAGTAARIIVTAKDTGTGETPTYRIAIVGLNLGLAGTLPVRPNAPTVERITAGMDIPATTLATIGIEAGKVRVAVPLPFTLSNEPPNTIYTPAPLRTAAPIINNRNGRRRPTPAPSPSASASPQSDSPAPAANTNAPAPSPAPPGVTPSALPSPGPT